MTTNDLDELADRDPLNLSKQDTDQIIQMYRNMRAGTVKPRKEMGPKVTIDLAKLGLAQPKEPVKRRI